MLTWAELRTLYTRLDRLRRALARREMSIRVNARERVELQAIRLEEDIDRAIRRETAVLLRHDLERRKVRA